MSNPIILLPVHKQLPSDLEVVSLRQSGRCLARKAVALLAPTGLDLSSYQEFFPSARVIRVEAEWMNSVRSYNRMMINPMIYRSFSHHSHILVHEPDAMVLRDELDFWCEQPYDYIGAPWFEGYVNAKPDAPLLGTGNFGFSLHRPNCGGIYLGFCSRVRQIGLFAYCAGWGRQAPWGAPQRSMKRIAIFFGVNWCRI
jgi:Protein of unknown function (DUF5672)